jgi:hypothetical protein
VGVSIWRPSQRTGVGHCPSCTSPIGGGATKAEQRRGVKEVEGGWELRAGAGRGGHNIRSLLDWEGRLLLLRAS